MVALWRRCGRAARSSPGRPNAQQEYAVQMSSACVHISSTKARLKRAESGLLASCVSALALLLVAPPRRDSVEGNGIHLGSNEQQSARNNTWKRVSLLEASTRSKYRDLYQWGHPALWVPAFFPGGTQRIGSVSLSHYRRRITGQPDLTLHW